MAHTTLSAIAAALFVCAGCTAESSVQKSASIDNVPKTEMNQEITVTIPNLLNPKEGLTLGGQPSEVEFKKLKDAGYGAVINLRPTGEPGNWNAAPVASEMGLGYHQLPVAGAAGVTRANAEALDSILKTVGDKPVLVHCASGARVGGLFALKAYYSESKSLDEAMAIGEQYGMRGLSGHVRTTIENNPR